MSTFSKEFEATISGLVKDSKSELKAISVKMSSEEIKQKKEELIQGLEAKQKLLLEQHQELMEKVRKMQQDAAIIYREGVGIEEQLQQLKSGPFAIAKEPKKKVCNSLVSLKTPPFSKLNCDTLIFLTELQIFKEKGPSFQQQLWPIW